MATDWALTMDWDYAKFMTGTNTINTHNNFLSR